MAANVRIRTSNVINVGITTEQPVIPAKFSSNPQYKVSSVAEKVVYVGAKPSVNIVNTQTVIGAIKDATDVQLANIQNNDFLTYNSNTQKFVNVSLNLTGGSNNQILVKKSGTNYDYEWEDMVIDFTPPAFTKIIDEASANITYLGEAVPNSVEASAVWRIQKILFDTNGGVDEIRYASGGLFNQIWNNRTSLTYV